MNKKMVFSVLAAAVLAFSGIAQAAGELEHVQLGELYQP